MPSEKRERQRQNRRLKQEQELKDERTDRIRQWSFMGVILAVALIGGLALISFATGDDDTDADEAIETLEDRLAEQSDEAGDQGSDEAGDQGSDEAGDQGSDEAGDEAADAAGASLPCPAEDGSSARTLEFPAPPPDCIDESATYTATFDTNLGTIVAELDAAKAPATVNNFVYLARYHYYDGTAFHRIIDDFVIQGGDPVGEPPGTGNPGYLIDEEPPQPGEYVVGSLAMAKGTPASTTGGQFFIVTGPNGEGLPNQYSLFGQVTEGLDVVEAIEGLPTDDRDFPTEEIVVNSVTIEG